MNPLSPDERDCLFADLSRSKLRQTGQFLAKPVLEAHRISTDLYIRWWAKRPTECVGCRQRTAWLLGSDDVLYSCPDCFTDVMVPRTFAPKSDEGTYDGNVSGAARKRHQADADAMENATISYDHVGQFMTMESARIAVGGPPVPWSHICDTLRNYCDKATEFKVSPMASLTTTPTPWVCYFVVVRGLGACTFGQLRECCPVGLLSWRDVPSFHPTQSIASHDSVRAMCRGVGITFLPLDTPQVARMSIHAVAIIRPAFAALDASDDDVTACALMYVLVRCPDAVSHAAVGAWITSSYPLRARGVGPSDLFPEPYLSFAADILSHHVGLSLLRFGTLLTRSNILPPAHAAYFEERFRRYVLLHRPLPHREGTVAGPRAILTAVEHSPDASAFFDILIRPDIAPHDLEMLSKGPNAETFLRPKSSTIADDIGRVLRRNEELLALLCKYNRSVLYTHGYRVVMDGLPSSSGPVVFVRRTAALYHSVMPDDSHRIIYEASLLQWRVTRVRSLDDARSHHGKRRLGMGNTVEFDVCATSLGRANTPTTCVASVETWDAESVTVALDPTPLDEEVPSWPLLAPRTPMEMYRLRWAILQVPVERHTELGPWWAQFREVTAAVLPIVGRTHQSKDSVEDLTRYVQEYAKLPPFVFLGVSADILRDMLRRVKEFGELHRGALSDESLSQLEMIDPWNVEPREPALAVLRAVLALKDFKEKANL